MSGPAPDEAIQAWGSLPFQRQVRQNEWHSACPVCGSTGHTDDGIPPNRFFIVAEPGNPDRTRGTCRRCGYTEFAINIIRRGHSDFLATRSIGDKHAAEATRLAEAERASALAVTARERFIEGKPWERFHTGMVEEDRAWWQSQGVPKEWQDYWLLGAVSDCLSLGPAYTIPFFGLDQLGEGGSRNPSTLQYRLQRPSNSGKYRFEPNLGVRAFIARPDLGIAGQVVYVVEGAKKAMVTHIYGTDSKIQVVGFPSKSSDGGIIDQLKLAAKVYIILDPDAWAAPPVTVAEWIPWPIRYSRSIGKHARVSRLPQKIDDALLDGSLDQQGLETILGYARSYA